MENQTRFDIFLCHNSEDKPEVKKIRDRLKHVGLHPWLDDGDLRAGGRWLKSLQERIVQIPSAAIFFGSHGIGRVQEHEIEILANEAMKRALPLIPVLLNSSVDKPNLSPLLELREWVDFREPDPIKKIFEGIKEKSIDEYLQELDKQKKQLEQRLQEVEIEIGKVTYSLSRGIDPSLDAVLEWLKGREDLAKKYGNLALRNSDIKKKLRERNEIELFYIEIDSCLELVFYALLENNESLLYEPGTPMLMDDENYKFSISEIYGVYRGVFNILKQDVPNKFEASARCKLESYLDLVVNRFLVDI